MNVVNVTQRRQRKSLLGTHRRARESILPPLSDTLFSIYEEKTVPRASIVPTEETITDVKVEVDRSSDLTHVAQRDEEIKTSPVSHFEAVRHPDGEDEDLSFRNERTLPIKRLDFRFSSPLNDDSFVDHETMLANDSSVLATALVEVSPEEKNALNNELPAAAEPISVNDHDTASENVPICDRFNSNVEKESVTNNDCDNSRRAIDQMIEFLDKRLWEKEEFHSSCSQQIEELEKKLDESRKEVEEMKAIKQFLLKKLQIPVRQGRENVNPDPTALMLPPKTESNKFVHEVKSQPSRQTRAPRASVLLTPHSMSLNVQSQFEDLLK